MAGTANTGGGGGGVILEPQQMEDLVVVQQMMMEILILKVEVETLLLLILHKALMAGEIHPLLLFMDLVEVVEQLLLVETEQLVLVE